MYLPCHHYVATTTCNLAAASVFYHTIDSAICGFHVYQTISTPVTHEQLTTSQDHGNAKDQFVVAACKVDSTTAPPMQVMVPCMKKYLTNMPGYFIVQVKCHGVTWKDFSMFVGCCSTGSAASFTHKCRHGS